MQVKVYHSGYGCESGCCGHIVEVDDENFGFEFTHPCGEDKKKWAIELAKEKIAKSSPECLASIDWDTIDFDGVSDC